MFSKLKQSSIPCYIVQKNVSEEMEEFPPNNRKLNICRQSFGIFLRTFQI